MGKGGWRKISAIFFLWKGGSIKSPKPKSTSLWRREVNAATKAWKLWMPNCWSASIDPWWKCSGTSACWRSFRYQCPDASDDDIGRRSRVVAPGWAWKPQLRQKRRLCVSACVLENVPVDSTSIPYSSDWKWSLWSAAVWDQHMWKWSINPSTSGDRYMNGLNWNVNAWPDKPVG